MASVLVSALWWRTLKERKALKGNTHCIFDWSSPASISLVGFRVRRLPSFSPIARPILQSSCLVSKLFLSFADVARKEFRKLASDRGVKHQSATGV